ncbi:MAG: hypothetical protein R3F20_14015 [Planctomycetota bacterium]
MHTKESRTRALAALGLFTVLAASAARAQDQSPTPPKGSVEELRRQFAHELADLRADYENRLQTMEGEIGRLRAERDDASAQGVSDAIDRIRSELDDRVGLGLSQTTVFDNLFNPAFGVVSDLILVASGQDDSFSHANRFVLRSVEVNIAGNIDPDTEYYAVLHADEDEIELEEAYLIRRDFFRETASLKAGRFNVDFGRVSPVHEHDLPFIDKPGVLQEYLGGSLRGTGLEYHDWFSLGDSGLLRFSAGITNSPDGDAHVIVGPLAGEHHHEEEEELFGERGIDSFAFHGRVTAQWDVGLNGVFQIGASVAWAPEVRSHLEDAHDHEEEKGAEDAEEAQSDLQKLVVGFDLGYRSIDPTDASGFTFLAEFLINAEEFGAEEEGKTDFETAFGFYAYVDYAFNREWALGVSVDWFEHRLDADRDWFDVGVFGTWKLNEFNRLRLEVRYVDDGIADESYWAAMLQWTVLIGSHGHGIDW